MSDVPFRHRCAPLLAIVAPLLLTGCASVLTGSYAPSSLDAPVTLPILSSVGAVIIPVEINGVSVASETASRSDATYLTTTDASTFRNATMF